MQMLSKIKIKKLTESDMQALCIVFQPAFDFVPTTQTDPLNCVYAIVAGLYKSIESKIQSFYLNPGKKYSLKINSTSDKVITNFSNFAVKLIGYYDSNIYYVYHVIN
jgi:hypothetical protein